ncbi:MAG: hypothetical protein DLM59_18160 [Pseudonocardiales bacterium]|nr:MAG: hypothetical protein DLM59_18160 [Pseudonocardiales bacterium]
MINDLYLPGGMVTTGDGVPGVCARHGEPALRRQTADFQSRPPEWSYALLLIAVLPFVVVTYLLRKSMMATGWPFCARCRARARWLRLVALGLLVAGIGIGYAGIRYPGHGSLSTWGCILSFAGFVVALMHAGPSRIARAEVTQDGLALRLRNAAPAFRAALPPAPLAVGSPAPPPSWAAGPARESHPGW